MRIKVLWMSTGFVVIFVAVFLCINAFSNLNTTYAEDYDDAGRGVFSIAEGSVFETNWSDTQTFEGYLAQESLFQSERENTQVPTLETVSSETLGRLEGGFPVVSSRPLFSDRKTLQLTAGVYYLGTYGDECIVILEETNKPVIAVEYQLVVDDVAFLGHFKIYVLKGSQWMGLKIALNQKYLTHEDLLQISLVASKAYYGHV